MADSNTVEGFAKVNPCELDKMVAESLKDTSSEDDGDDLESDDELMRQLKEMTDGPLIVTNNQQHEADRVLSTSALITVDVLKHRIEMYKLAEANAKTSGQSAKVRRIRRGLTRLNGLLSQTNAGEQIVEDDIPPEVTTKPTKENAVTGEN